MRGDGRPRRGRPPRLAAVQLLLTMGVGMAILVFGGYALDRALGTSPWFLLAGTVSGVAFIMYDLLHRARRERGGGESGGGG